MRAVAQTTTSISGRVLGYLANRVGDYDGLRLRIATGEVHLSFPPHAAARIRPIAATGQQVTADVAPGLARPVPGIQTEEKNRTIPITYRLIRLRNEKSGITFQLADFPPPPPQSGQLVQSEGPLVKKLYDEQGRLTALLTDKYLLELKPHQIEQISSLLDGVKRVGFTGFERTAEGFVNQTGRPVLHPTSLTIRGQTFAL
ncbi:hypothetical protein GCM10028807_34750 [Spirosoma daeguense]